MADLPVILSGDDSGLEDADMDDDDFRPEGCIQGPAWFQKIARETIFTAMGDFLSWHSGPSQESPPLATERLTGGPKRKASVAIIGGGPAGVHMAYMLKRMRGFDIHDVTIFEKTERIGGKSRSFHHRGAVHEMGTCYMSPDYKQVKQLLEEFDVGEQVEVVGRTVWDPENPSRGIKFKKWMFREVARSMGDSELKMSRLRCAWEVFRQSFVYADLHKQLLGEYSGFLMPRPSKETLKTLDMSIADFLDQNGLNALKPIFLLAFSLQGYGFLEKTSALYGLLWVTPNLLTGLIEQVKFREALSQEQLRASPSGERRTITTLVGGFERLWQAMVKQLDIHVLRKVTITSVQRDVRGAHIMYTLSTGEERQESFDFLVVAAPIQDVLPILDAHEDEKRIFSRVETSTFVTTLFDYESGKKPNAPAIDSWFYNIKPGIDWSIWSLRDTHQLLRQNSYSVVLDDPNVSTAVSYQFADRPATKKDEEEVAERHTQHFERHNMRNIEVVKREMWSYFPKYNTGDMSDGVLWDILELQGKYGTWYTGAWASFEAVNAIVDYNKMLVEVWAEQERNPVGLSRLVATMGMHLGAAGSRLVV